MTLCGLDPFRLTTSNYLDYFLLALFIPTEQNWHGNSKILDESPVSRNIYRRLVYLMVDVYDEVVERSQHLNHERFTFEDSNEYQQGYVFHEIMERYRKLVMQLKRASEYYSTTVYDNVDKNEKIQRLYFEIYNFVKYIRIIPTLTYPEDKDEDLSSYNEEKQQISKFKDEYLKQERERRDALKKEKKRRKKLRRPEAKITKKDQLLNLISKLNATGNLTGDAGNKFLGQYIADAKSKLVKNSWLFEYGWDIEYWD